MSMSWSAVTTERFKIAQAVGNSGDEHSCDVLISKSVHHQLYTKGSIRRTRYFDDGSERVETHVAPSDKWEFPPSPMNVHFNETRLMLEDNSEYFCIEQLDREVDYEITTGVKAVGEDFDKPQSLTDLFIGTGRISVDGVEVTAPSLIEDIRSKEITCLEPAHFITFGATK